MNSMEVKPTAAERERFPDRLWLSDHTEEPAKNSTTWWALSNDLGETPAYWRAVPPVDLSPASLVVDSSDAASALERRIPDLVTIYLRPGCSAQTTPGLDKKCRNFLTPFCCSRPSGTAFGGRSTFIPSFAPGDINVAYSTYQCSGGSPPALQYGFTGCYTAPNPREVNSVFLASCVTC